MSDQGIAAQSPDEAERAEHDARRAAWLRRSARSLRAQAASGSGRDAALMRRADYIDEIASGVSTARAELSTLGPMSEFEP
jgi:hypothetical protein